MASEHVEFLRTSVANLKTVGAGLRALAADHARRIREVAGDREASLALASELDQEAADDAKAITDNTVASGEAPPLPPA